MTEDLEDWAKKCMSCIHCYRKKNDADYLYCRLKDYCRYEIKEKKKYKKQRSKTMTEELKQKAEKSRLSTKNGHDLSYDPKYREVYDKAYIAGATEETKELQEELNYQKQARSIAENAIVDLSKENAELKKDNEGYEKDNALLVNRFNQTSAKLSKAKEIIKDLLNVFPYDMPEEELDSGHKDMVKEAEEFLKEVEK